MERKKYETTFLFTADLTEKERKDLVSQYTKFLEEQKVKIDHTKDPVHRKLAYPIKKRESAVYQTIEFAADPSVIAKLEVRYKRNERILRFLTVRLNKEAAEYQAQQRAKDFDKASVTNNHDEA